VIRIKIFWKTLYVFVPLIVLGCAVLLSVIIEDVVKFIPQCPVYSRLHILCPGCGNTRSVAALLWGDILTSLKYNATVLLLCVIAVIYYMEGFMYIFVKPIVIIPRKLTTLYVILSVMIVYYVVRNF